MSSPLPIKLAQCSSKGYVIAPAGYGKTHLIALAVKEANHRQLVLTHTYAGVHSIKAKMKALRVPASLYQVDTIASWALRLCISYPKTSGWDVTNPTGKQWGELYAKCQYLLAKKFIRHIVSATYTGMYVDEYQDCSDKQHELVCSIAELLPCRILGDPLQAIFDFADKPVDWDAAIYPHFTCLGRLETPWRWINSGAEELGLWLKSARHSLETGNTIDLSGSLPKSVQVRSVDLNDYQDTQRLSLFYPFLNDSASTVIAIQAGDQWAKNKTHSLAKGLAGKFSSLEEVEGTTLFAFINNLQKATNAKNRLLIVVDFAKKCLTGVSKVLVAKTARGEVAKVSKATKTSLIPIVDASNLYLGDQSSQNLKNLLQRLSQHTDTQIYRRDLFNRLFQVLNIHIANNEMTLLEAAESYQLVFRHAGRPVRHTKLIATTLLVKGLEYDHAILLEADMLDRKQLYVAMTRGARSLTIITTKTTLPTN